ncbi:MAG: ScyD/ScyE family protein [Acidimicrobiia bacterium]|nr:ScyD/ScyE family protein [Acidimicrobiia bacterium]
MSAKRSLARLGGVAAVSAAALTTVGVPVPAGAQPPGWEVVASGLDAPRDLAWGLDGELLVAEAGRGGDTCVELPSEGPDDEGSELCFGLTSGVTEITEDGQERVLDGLPSVSVAGPAGEEPIGVEDLSTDHWTGETYLAMGLGATPEERDSLLPEAGSILGHLVRVVGDGVEPVADLAQYEADQNPDSGEPGSEVDSNPEGVLAVYGQQFVVDAGGNDLLHRGVDGHLSTLAVFGATEQPAPPFLELPPGATIPAQAVPTEVVLGPDGALYVSELTGFPFTVGSAKVLRWDANGVTTYAEGFTNIVDIDFGPDGSLYVLELAQDSLLAPESGGRLTRIGPDGDREVVEDEGLPFPTSVLVGEEGDLYLTVNGVAIGGGEVWHRSAP